MTPEAKDAPTTLSRPPVPAARPPAPAARPPAPAARPPAPAARPQWKLRLLHALLLVALGGWLLVRGLQTLQPDVRLPAGLAYGGGAASTWGAFALFVGGALLVAAPTLPAGRARAWLGAAVAALLALVVVLSAWILGSGGDWLGALLALAAVVALAAPSARTLYLADAQP